MYLPGSRYVCAARSDEAYPIFMRNARMINAIRAFFFMLVCSLISNQRRYGKAKGKKIACSEKITIMAGKCITSRNKLSKDPDERGRICAYPIISSIQPR
jgi:hypothetical protein